MDALAYLAIANLCISAGLLVCYVTFIVQCFMNGESEMGAIWLVTCCCGIGWLGSLIYGWTKVDEWENAPLMLTWTLFFVLYLIVQIVLYSATRSFAPLA